MDSSLLTLHLIMLLILWRGAIASIRKRQSEYSKTPKRIYENAQANIRNAPHEYSKMPKRIFENTQANNRPTTAENAL